MTAARGVLLATADLSCVTAAGPSELLSIAWKPGEISALSAQGEFQTVILDLGMPGLDVASIVAQLRADQPAVQIVAFGPHVQEARLQEAQSAGCDLVLTRGQFHARARELVLVGL